MCVTCNLLCVWWQAASYAGAAANEDRSDTQLTYRERKAAEGYPKYLEHVCGTGGSEGSFPFKTKRRPPSAGGNWTYELSKQERPKNGRGVYKQFTTARSTGRKYFFPARYIEKTARTIPRGRPGWRTRTRARTRGLMNEAGT